MAVRGVTHVIFDMDGLLFDTEQCYTDVFQQICSEYGKTFTRDIKEKQMGMRENDGIQLLIDELDIPLTVLQFQEKSNKLLRTLLPNAPVLPGVKKLVEHLYKNKIPIAIATGSCGDKFKLKTEKHRWLLNMFNHVVLASDPEVVNSKPAPDIYTICCSRFPNPPPASKVLVFEDSPNGVISASEAGMQVVWVPHPEANRSKAEATIILNSIEEFEPPMFGLPPYPEVHH
ncbi:pseudouridine-5'-phosphatase-like [Argonauta hians]